MERRPNCHCASDAENDRGYELFCCLFHNQMIAGRVTFTENDISDSKRRVGKSGNVSGVGGLGRELSSSSFVPMW